MANPSMPSVVETYTSENKISDGDCARLRNERVYRDAFQPLNVGVIMGLLEKMDDKERTLAATIACAKACRECAGACLEEKDIDMLRNCIRLDRDCAWICDLTEAYLEANSSFQAQACRLCAEICEACAEECGHHEDMAHCRDCAAACRKCADECLNFASAMV